MIGDSLKLSFSGKEFVLNVDDTLYFTCNSIEEFAQFSETNGLEVVTNENLDGTKHDETINHSIVTDQREKTVQFAETVRVNIDTEEGMPPLSIEMKSPSSRPKQQGDKLKQINKLRGEFDNLTLTLHLPNSSCLCF